MHYKTTGIIKYYDHSAWIILHADTNIVRYYAWWLFRFRHIKVHPPKNGAHITVVAGKYENLALHTDWGKYRNKQIEFRYDNTIFEDGNGYFWLGIDCPFLAQVRGELGLTPTPKYDYHMTIGKVQQ